jgi:serine/threonine-protein kinase RsbW
MPPAPEDAVPEAIGPETGRSGSWGLEIPSDAVYISTARLFAAAIARHFGVDEDLVDDLKLAISEACNGAIRLRKAEAGNRPIRIDVSAETTSLSFEIEDAIEAGPSLAGDTTGDLTRGLSIELIQALFPQAEMLAGPGGGTSLRLSLPLAPK